jgi:hypothetical protein
LTDPQTTEKLTFWLGETRGFWVQTGALFVSAIAGIWIILSRSKTERRRATVDLVLHLKNDLKLVEAKSHLLQLHDKGTVFATFLDQKDSPEHKAITRVLNTHEFVAGGIREKAYDEKLYKRMQCSVIVRDWDAFCGFVMEFRKSKEDKLNESAETFYQDFEWLAKKWKASPLKVTRPWFTWR